MDDITAKLKELAPSTVNNIRSYFLRLVNSYQKKKHPSYAHRLETEFGMCIDEKDYGADQGVERGDPNY